MDAAAKPPGTGLRRLPQPDPPRLPTDSQLLPLTLTLIRLRLRQVQGCKPCRPTYLRGASCSSISQDFRPRGPR
ncbi:hypothetical protein B9Y61_13510 [Stenotrophomonas maltophilia]|nr:hypothetical protein B9Y61_13510 [Stenotrophomonas maltophilia]